MLCDRTIFVHLGNENSDSASADLIQDSAKAATPSGFEL